MKPDALDIIGFKIEVETRIAILRSALEMAAEQPAAFEMLRDGLAAIQEVRPGWPRMEDGRTIECEDGDHSECPNGACACGCHDPPFASEVPKEAPNLATAQEWAASASEAGGDAK